MLPVTPLAVAVPMVMATKLQVQQCAMPCRPARTVGMAQFEHVKKVISVKVKPPINPLAHPEPTPPTPVSSNVSNVLQGRLLHQKKQLNVNHARKGGFKLKKAKRNA